MDEILAFARRHDLAVVEHAAQAHGVAYRGRVTGCIGDFGAFSLNVSKNLPTCGEGGLLTVDDDDDLTVRITMMRQFDVPQAVRDHNVRGFLRKLAGLAGPAEDHAGPLRVAVGRALRGEGVPESRYQSMPLADQPGFRYGYAEFRSCDVSTTNAVVGDSFVLQRVYLNPAARTVLDLSAPGAPQRRSRRTRRPDRRNFGIRAVFL